MRLLVLLREARDRLNADLRRFFGVSLTDMYEGRISVEDVADYSAHLPRGGAVAEWLGGWAAITAEDEALRRIEYVLVATNTKRKPKPPAPPPSLRDNEISRRKNAEVHAAKKAALRRMSQMYGGH